LQSIELHCNTQTRHVFHSLVSQVVAPQEMTKLIIAGTYLTDLTFIDEGIPSNIRKSDLINFSKRVKTAEVISDIEMFQNVTYPFTPVKELHEIMIPVINEAPDVGDQYERSLKLEPREREDEKIAR
jgi:son of sevenless-like protein